MSRQPTGRVLVGVSGGEPFYDDFTPARVWFYKPAVFGWPVRFGRGSDEAGNRTVGVFTWFGSIIVATPRRLRSSTTPEFEAWMLSEIPNRGLQE